MWAAVHRRRTGTVAGRSVWFILLSGLLVLASGCAHHASPQATSPPQAPSASSAAKPAAAHAALTDMATRAEDIYNLARSGKWQQAAKAYSSIKQDIQVVDAQAQGQEDRRAELRTQFARLGDGLKSRDKYHACLAANELSWRASQMYVIYGAHLGIARLRWDGRKVQMYAEAKNTAALLSATTDLMQTWTGVRTEIFRRGGRKQAKAFGQAVSRIARAPSPEACAAAVSTLLDQISDLAAVVNGSGGH